MTVSAIQIGLDPAVIDYDAPGFARFEGLTREKLTAAMEDNLAGLRAAGYDVDMCAIDFGETALGRVAGFLDRKAYDAALIGAGVRLVPGNTLLFEAIVNLVHERLPGVRFVFNQGPEATPDDIRRWLPNPLSPAAR
jgi:hypothetical protein